MMLFSVDGAGAKTTFDHTLIVCVVLLTGVGLVSLYSASYAFAELWFQGDRWHFVFSQSIRAVVGFILFFIAANINMETLRSSIMFLVIAAAVLCALTFVPGIGMNINGASRWIGAGGFSFQPSELVKLVLPLYLAHIFDKKKDNLKSFSSGILPPVVVTALFFGLILSQNNFSTAVFIAANALIIFFLAGVGIGFFVGAAMIILPVTFLLVLLEEHRLRRLISFIWPDWEPLGAGYQVQASILTISSGGFWGKGLGQGTRKIVSVPEVHSDFIFSAYSEEGGFIGVALFILAFAVFAWRGYRAALKADSAFKRLAACGLVTAIFTQMLLNIAVVSGAAPATGVPLPFFSAGGSSLLVSLVMSGFIVNISRAPVSSLKRENMNNGVYNGI
ncbi:MAG: putative lipid II flippase FtsW [Spirochaetaceae bacterium]|jgi:cell division protein FtsW|nr:putative lipid II flippase FtsW [Spirochaetaceae bacterium]